MDNHKLTQKLQEIAQHLDDWTYDLDSPLHMLCHPSGASLFARIDVRTRRLVFTPNFGEATDHRPTVWDDQKKRRTYPPDAISVDPKRVAEAIARDLGRRLIPQFLPLYEQAVQAKHQADRKAETQRQVRDRLVNLLGEWATTSTYKHEHLDHFSWSSPTPGRWVSLNGSVRPDGQDVDIQFNNLPVWLGEELVQHVKTRIDNWNTQQQDDMEVSHAT